MRRKIFVDENLPPLVASALSATFKKHLFRSATDESLRSVEDVVLCRDLADRDYDAIITGDRNQLVNTPERVALREAGLHWIGLPAVEATGVEQIAAQLSLTVPAVADLLTSWPEEPTALRLRAHLHTVLHRETL